MPRKKVDCDWKLYEFSLEELEIILKDASSDAEDRIKLNVSQKPGGNHV